MVNTYLIHSVRLGLEDDTTTSVLIDQGLVLELDPVAASYPQASVLNGQSTALLPGLVDHHVHIGAWLRSQRSTEIRGVCIAEELVAALPDNRGWRVLFGLDHHHDVRQALAALDEVQSPCVIVHRTGHAVLMNAHAAKSLGRGSVTKIDHGRGLWGEALGPVEEGWEAQHLHALSAHLLQQGVVAIQDATPYPARASERCRFLQRALAPIRVSFMSDPVSELGFATFTKVLDPTGMPPVSSYPSAVHAIEPVEILQAIALLKRNQGRFDRSSRIEHAAICPPLVAEQIREAGVTVCSNPAFLMERSTALEHLRISGVDEFLCPVAMLKDLGVPVIFGSDAPVTKPGVWASVRAAVARGAHEVPFAGEALSMADAMSAVTVREVPLSRDGWRGMPGDLVLLDLGQSLFDSGCSPVKAVFIGGVLVFGNDFTRG